MSQARINTEHVDLPGLVASLGESDAQLAACGAHMLETMAASFEQASEHAWQSIANFQMMTAAHSSPMPLPVVAPQPVIASSKVDGTAATLMALGTIMASVGAWKGDGHKAAASVATPTPNDPPADAGDEASKSDSDSQKLDAKAPIKDEPEVKDPQTDTNNGVVPQGVDKNPEPPPPAE